MDLETSINYLETIMNRFYPIGSDKNGGVTRLAYTEMEDEMHDEFKSIGKEEGYNIEVDQVGNTFLSNGDHKEYYLVGSHLDSVISGGRFDGVLGVGVGLLLLKKVKEENLNIPLKVAAFRCEESSNFMKATLGSSLITGEYNPSDFEVLKSRDGKSLMDIFKERGYDQTPEVIQGIKAYLELHIEQGRILESENLPIGIVSTIAGNTRFKVNIKGLAEHSGATPMNIRQDALCGAADIILGIEKIGQEDFSGTAVTTVGVIENHPNSLNVIPGEVEFSVDIRDGDNDNIEKIRLAIYEMIDEVCKKRNLAYEMEYLSSSSAVQLNNELIAELIKIATNLDINHKVMPSGAGHDAMKFAKLTKTAMIFVPCKGGISHNPKEDASIKDAALGASIIFQYLKGGN
ncbi:MAG: M20 family metallo-hydrolase [Tissierellaceae bacterium]|nr:M20 family metallo-hydrolase [Tissierellaceae bacterium]